MSVFDQAVEAVLLHEGGYSNNPHDAGGETNFGICKRSYPNVDIKHLTRDEAIEIYRRDFWKPYMELLPPCIAVKTFDMAVNMGEKRAIKLLQRAAGCDEDGQIGPVTLASVKVWDANTLLNRLVHVQREFYTMLAETKPSNKVFLKGWLARANYTPEVA